MTEAETELLDLILRPEFQDGVPTGTLREDFLKLRRSVALERVPDGFQEDLAAAIAKAKSARDAVNDLGRRHPAVCYGHEGLIAKLGGV